VLDTNTFCTLTVNLEKSPYVRKNAHVCYSEIILMISADLRSYELHARIMPCLAYTADRKRYLSNSNTILSY